MKLRIMIVDDSSVMRMLLARGLRQAGFDVVHVIEAGNGTEALAQFRPGEIDIVFCDLAMPTMDGYEFVTRLRQVAPAIPILLITAEGSPAKMDLARRCGASEVIQKPPTLDELQRKVPALLGLAVSRLTGGAV
ncbi:MAG: response regulator [Planctomycetes bacterium]|nr:response regulator [Planctomycetota bacterium]